MVEVTYYRSHNRVTVRGHAVGEEIGSSDLVCSAASILAYTLADRVQCMAKEEQVRNPVTRMDPGDSEIECRPKHKYVAVVTLVFDTICAGFELLAQSFPNAAKFEVHEG